MQLLCLTDADPKTPLPGLGLLPHVCSTTPLSVTFSATAASRFDLLLIDAGNDLHRARAVCVDLARDCPTPRLLLCPESALAAVTAEWAVADVLLPQASPAEIEMRLRLAQGRSTDIAADTGTPSEVSAAGVVIDEGSFIARVHDRPLDLTYKEFELLHFLISHPSRVFTREQLLSEVWGTDYYGGTRTVDVHVRRLRAKLGEQEGLISTVRGVGYGFARSNDESEDQ